MRDLTKLEPGRHAKLLDQVDAFLWCADVRFRALQLADSLQDTQTRQDYLTELEFAEAIAKWVESAYELLCEVSRG